MPVYWCRATAILRDRHSSSSWGLHEGHGEHRIGHVRARGGGGSDGHVSDISQRRFDLYDTGFLRNQWAGSFKKLRCIIVVAP